MKEPRLIQQSNSLISLIDDELLTDSTIAGWHSALLGKAKASFAQIQQQFETVTEEDIRARLGTPMKALRQLVEEVHLSSNQKLQLSMQLGEMHYLLGQRNQALDILGL